MFSVPRQTIVAFTCTILLLVTVLVIPSSAHADVLSDLGGAVKGAFTGPIKDVVQEIFKAISEFMFGGLAAKIHLAVIKWLVAHPVFTDHKFADLNEFRSYMQVASYSLLTLVALVVGLRLMGAGLTDSGSGEAASSLTRVGFAAIAIGAWPELFGQFSVWMNQITHGLLGAPGIADGLSNLFDPTSGNPLYLVSGILMPLLFLLLIFAKLGLSALLAILYIAGPLALALWPLSLSSWVGRTVLFAVAGAFIWPFIWCICFAAFALLSQAVFVPETLHALPTSLIQPLIALACLYLAFKLPIRMMNQALVSASMPRGVAGGAAGAARRFMPSGTSGGGGGAAKLATEGVEVAA